MESIGFVFSTGRTAKEAKDASKAIKGYYDHNLKNGRPTLSEVPKDMLPVICIISGTGNVGKTSFIRCCGKYCSAMDMSVVEPLYDVAANLIKSTMDDNRNYIAETDLRYSNDECNVKSEPFRSLMHSLKVAWDEYYHGSETYAIGRVIGTIMKRAVYNIIFINCREPESIKSLVERLNELGFIAVTLLIRGNVDPNNHDNDADRNVMDFEYDVVIDNCGSIYDLDYDAMCFVYRILEANGRYGFPCLPVEVCRGIFKEHRKKNAEDGTAVDHEKLTSEIRAAVNNAASF